LGWEVKLGETRLFSYVHPERAEEFLFLASLRSMWILPQRGRDGMRISRLYLM
jgi:hypothetical protein